MEGIDRLECVYFSNPIPANRAVLTVLSLLYDKIYFPHVYLPMGNYDEEALEVEIARLEALKPLTWDTAQLIGMLKFLKYRSVLDGILEYPTPRDEIFGGGGDAEASALAMAVYNANVAPRDGFIPSFDSATLKALPNSDEAVETAGDFYYQGRAISFAAKHGLPLLDDGSGPALPFRAQYKDNAKGLSSLLAVESVALALPQLPVLGLQELVDFRVENEKELRAFRSAMLRYARTLNDEVTDDMPPDEVMKKVKFLVETEIGPTMHDLQRDLHNPNRPWHKRLGDGARIASSVLVAVLTGGAVGKTAAEALRDAALGELEARGEKEDRIRRNGLYYLLKAQELSR